MPRHPPGPHPRVRSYKGGFVYTTGGWATGWLIQPADFNGDGRGDMFLYNPGTGRYFKVITLAGVAFHYTEGWASRGQWPLVVDLNGDRRSDLFFYDPLSGLWDRCTSTGDGTAGFACASGGWRAGWQVHAADFDADGRSDLFLYDPAVGDWYKVLGRSNGFHYVAGGWALWSITVGDLNGDGDSDVLLVDSSGSIWP